MRLAVLLIAVAALAGACSPPETDKAPAPAPGDATAGSSGAGRVAGAVSALLDPISLQGIWSFDRTCASGDGMTLSADGTVSYDEWGDGLWAINEAGQLVMILRRHEPGVEDDNLGERVVYTLTASAGAGDDLAGQLEQQGGEHVEINAKRCAD